MQVANNKVFLSECKKAVKAIMAGALILLAISESDASTTAIPAGTSILEANKAEGILSRFSFETGLEYSQRVAEGEQVKREESLDITLAPGFKVNDNLKVSARTVLTKDNTGANDTQASDTILNLSIRGKKINPELSTVHSIYGVVPTSEKSREQDRLQSGVGLSSGLHFANALWDITYRIGYTQLFHEFNFNAAGSPNMQQSLSNSLGIQFKVTEKISFAGLGTYRWGQTYGKKERSSYEIHGDINYQATSKMALNLGTSNAGQALKANGVDSNITAFDPDKGVIRAGISISL